MKKLALFMIGWLVLLLTVGTVLIAAEPLTLTSSEQVVVSEGASFQTAMVLENAQDIAAFQLRLLYDVTRFEVISVQKGPELASEPVVNIEQDGLISVNYSDITKTVSGDFVLFTVSMRVIGALESDEIVLFTADESFTEIITLHNGNIQIVEHIVYDFKPVVRGLYGDVNLDGRVSILDAVMIQLYLADMYAFTDVQKALADVNVDGLISVLDVVMIQLYLAGFIDRLGQSIEDEEDPILPRQYPGWGVFLNDWDGSEASTIFEDNVMTVVLSNINFWENWQLQIFQDADTLGIGAEFEGTMHFEAGKTYRLKFTASASVVGNVSVVFSHFIGGFTQYYSESITVGTNMTDYTIIFTLDDEDMDYSIPARLSFEMGLLFAGQVAPQSFSLTNVHIDVLVEEEYVETDLVFNSHMAEGPVVYFVYGWRTFVNDWEGSAANIYGEDGMLVLDITAANFSHNWQLQIIQDAFALNTGGVNEGSMQFEAGRTYRVRFTSMASTVGEISFAIGYGWTSYFVEEGILVGPTMKHHEIIFTLDSVRDFSVLGQFRFEMGMLFSGKDGPQQFRLGNVSLEIEEDGIFVDAGLLVNGEMELGQGVTPDQFTYWFGYYPPHLWWWEDVSYVAWEEQIWYLYVYDKACWECSDSRWLMLDFWMYSGELVYFIDLDDVMGLPTVSVDRVPALYIMQGDQVIGTQYGHWDIYDVVWPLIDYGHGHQDFWFGYWIPQIYFWEEIKLFAPQDETWFLYVYIENDSASEWTRWNIIDLNQYTEYVVYVIDINSVYDMPTIPLESIPTLYVMHGEDVVEIFTDPIDIEDYLNDYIWN